MKKILTLTLMMFLTTSAFAIPAACWHKMRTVQIGIEYPQVRTVMCLNNLDIIHNWELNQQDGQFHAVCSGDLFEVAYTSQVCGIGTPVAVESQYGEVGPNGELIVKGTAEMTLELGYKNVFVHVRGPYRINNCADGYLYRESWWAVNNWSWGFPGLCPDWDSGNFEYFIQFTDDIIDRVANGTLNIAIQCVNNDPTHILWFQKAGWYYGVFPCCKNDLIYFQTTWPTIDPVGPQGKYYIDGFDRSTGTTAGGLYYMRDDLVEQWARIMEDGSGNPYFECTYWMDIWGNEGP